jgi:hypothetical protein
MRQPIQRTRTACRPLEEIDSCGRGSISVKDRNFPGRPFVRCVKGLCRQRDVSTPPCSTGGSMTTRRQTFRGFAGREMSKRRRQIIVTVCMGLEKNLLFRRISSTPTGRNLFTAAGSPPAGIYREYLQNPIIPAYEESIRIILPFAAHPLLINSRHDWHRYLSENKKII